MTPWKRKEVIGNAELYLGDCLEILPHLPKVDAVITDPPYGMGHQPGSRAKTAKQQDGNLWGKSWGVIYGDDKPFVPSDYFGEWGEFKHWALFGANHFNDSLPRGKRWLVFHKGVPDGMSYSDSELVWTNIPGGAVQQKSILWSGFRRATEVREHLHPTQKPVDLMVWVIEQFPTFTSCVDPFMGSGTTGVACMNLGRKFIGIEIEPKYFDIACERIENAQRQERLFV